MHQSFCNHFSIRAADYEYLRLPMQTTLLAQKSRALQDQANEFGFGSHDEAKEFLAPMPVNYAVAGCVNSLAVATNYLEVEPGVAGTTPATPSVLGAVRAQDTAAAVEAQRDKPLAAAVQAERDQPLAAQRDKPLIQRANTSAIAPKPAQNPGSSSGHAHSMKAGEAWKHAHFKMRVQHALAGNHDNVVQGIDSHRHDRLFKLFRMWDTDGSGTVDEKEFMRAMKMLGLKATTEDFRAFVKKVDKDGSGSLDINEIAQLLQESKILPVGSSFKRHAKRPLAVRALIGAYEVLNLNVVQCILYMAFVVIFALLSDSMRLKAEYHLDKRVSESFLENEFDVDHSTFGSIRRMVDVWAWGNNVLIPGLFGEQKPACGNVGDGDFFHSAREHTAALNLSMVGTADGPKAGCNDDVWPDAGSVSVQGVDGATSLTVLELIERMNQME